MQRRNFIKTSAAGSAFLAANNMFLFQQCKEPEILSQNQMDPIITILFLTNHEDEMLTQMIGMKTRFGFQDSDYYFPIKAFVIHGFRSRKPTVNLENFYFVLKINLRRMILKPTGGVMSH